MPPVSLSCLMKRSVPLRLGRYLYGSLTRKPVNTAAIAGSNNITLECASYYGTEVTGWSFTPLGSFSNETIEISRGYQLLETNQLQYILQATPDASVLIVRQLSSLTEGTYICSDGVDWASALLLVIRMYINLLSSIQFRLNLQATKGGAT